MYILPKLKKKNFRIGNTTYTASTSSGDISAILQAQLPDSLSLDVDQIAKDK